MNRRLTSIEEMNEDLDLDALKEKGDKVTMTDILDVIKNFQSEILKKSVTQVDMDAIREQMNEIEF